ncbi:MAG: hypothetical protein U0414_26980 [Polyangiaceae bacterium]
MLRTLVRPLLVATVGLALVACGGGDSKGTGSSSAKAKGKGAPTSAPGSTGAANTGAANTNTAVPAPTFAVAPGKGLSVPVWWGGMKYTLGDVRYDAGEHTLLIDVEIDNLLKSNQNPQPTALLESNGEVLSHGGLKDYKEIVAKSKVRTALTFDVSAFDASKTTLVFGDGAEAQVRVPLSGAGPNVTDEPVKQAFTGDIVIGPATFTVQSTEVRWDWYPHDTGTIKKDKAALLLFGKLKAPSDKEIFAVTEKFELTQPDGTKLTADVLGPDSHVAMTKTEEDFYVLFTIDAKDRKYAGDYTLNVTQDWGADGAAVSSGPVKLSLK